MGYTKILKGIMLLMISSTLISCAGNLEGLNSLSSENTTSSLDENDSIVGNVDAIIDTGVSEKTIALMKDVDKSEKEAEPMYEELEKQEKKIQTINIISFLLALPFKATTETSPQEKLKNPVTSVLDGILKVVNKAYALDDKLRSRLELIVSDLNPEIESHAKALEKIDKLHARMDKFDSKMSKTMFKLISTTDKIILKIKLKKATYFPIDPRALLLNVGHGYFTDFKSELMTYMEDEL